MIHPYSTPEYAAGLGHIGQPLAVPEWGTHVLVRQIPQSEYHDATGIYPIMPLGGGVDLAGGIARLKAHGLVSVVMILDDVLRPPLATLETAFDVVRPFKSHYLHDRGVGPPVYGKHHRYEIRRAGTHVEASEVVLADHLPAWRRLYAELAARHEISGFHAFSSSHHATLSRMAGLRSFGAFIDGALVSAHLFVTHAGHAMSHLAASAPEGYRTGAAYVVNALALERLDDCQFVNFGGAAGMVDNAADGLARFKKGFSNRVARSYLCGALLDRSVCQKLSNGFAETEFFPAYRGARR